MKIKEKVENYKKYKNSMTLVRDRDSYHLKKGSRNFQGHSTVLFSCGWVNGKE